MTTSAPLTPPELAALAEMERKATPATALRKAQAECESLREAIKAAALMTRARQPRAVTAWALSHGCVLHPDTRSPGARYRDRYSHVPPRVSPLPAKDATSEGVATGPEGTASPSGARKKANLSRSKRTGQAAAGRPGPATKRRRK